MPKISSMAAKNDSTKTTKNKHQNTNDIMDYKKLQEFIKAIDKTGIAEVKIETEEMRLVIRKELPNKGKEIIHMPAPTVASSPVVSQSVPPVATQPAVEDTPKTSKNETQESSNTITIKAPMVGTFYRKPAPDKPPYVNVGDEVKEGDVICIIEAMKLFNEIEAEVAGKIVKVLVDDASPVEFDQPLFLVEPY
jgi:acetyl-CoA carboxylase biotin carboxyl carrier protein